MQLPESGFLLSGRGGVTPLPPLSGPSTIKTTFFMCVFPKRINK